MSKVANEPIKNGVAKVPVIMQMEMLECGAASLSMILAYYGRWIPLEQMRVDCGISRDGSNAKNIVLAAMQHGMEVEAYKMEPDALFDEGSFPCIVHWEFDHFIVVTGFRGKKVYVNDPARGSVTMSLEEFDRGFTGIVLMFKPGENFEPQGSKKSILKYAVSRLDGAKRGMAFLVLCMVASMLINIIKPGYTRIFVDSLLSKSNVGWTTYFIALLVITGLFEITVTWLQSLTSYRLGGKMAAISSTKFMRHVLNLPMEFFSQRMPGDIQMRAASNSTIVETFVNVFVPLFLNFVLMIFYLIVMVKYSIILALIGIAGIVINMMISKIIADLRVNIMRVQMRDAGKLSSTTVSGIYMIESIKSSGAENGFFEKWSGYQASVNAQEIRFKRIDCILGMIPEMVSAISAALVLIVGSYLIMQGKFSVGMLMAFQGLLTGFMNPANDVIEAGKTIQEMRTDMERIEDVMQYEESLPYSSEKFEGEDYKLSGNIEIKNLTFGYSKLKAPLIEDFNMSLATGKKVAFVGGSGSGKSTLAKLISGLYQPWSGEILYDGKHISEIEKSRFNGSVAVVDQEITLFEDTIANNIKMWDETIEDFEVIMAARDAAIHKDISERSGAYNYVLSEGGRNLSGGQRQRLEIARALAADPTIIILDEATSALDAQTEYEVINSIADRGITCIVVAHRLSTIRDCDEIVVLDKGKVVERGTHEELYAAKGHYYELVTSD